MLLLLDIGNTHTHLAVTGPSGVRRPLNLPTTYWRTGQMIPEILRHLRGSKPDAVAICSVVPKAAQAATRELKRAWGMIPFQLTHRTARGIGIDYPHPETIGPDRLANAIAARQLHGAPVVVVDFGTAVTFDVVSRRGSYIGGIIAPGLAAMTTYLHEKTALLPQIKIRETSRIVGRSTEEAMLVGAVRGYRGLIKELILDLRAELHSPRLPVVATGGYARLMAAKLPEIKEVDPLLTLKGLKLAWEHAQ